MIKNLFYAAVVAIANVTFINAEACQSSFQPIFYVEGYLSPDTTVAIVTCPQGYDEIKEGVKICFRNIHITIFLEMLLQLGKTHTIAAEKIYVDGDIGEDGKAVFESIFGHGTYKTDFLREPERFLDCILSGDELELSAQEDLRQKLIELGWSDDSAKTCKVVLNWPENLQYEYKSANHRLERVTHGGL